MSPLSGSRFLIVFFFLFSLGAVSAFPAQAQASIEISQPSVDYLFNHHLHFSAAYQSDKIIQEAYVYFQWPGSQRSWFYMGELEDARTFDVSVTLDGSNSPPPFSEVTYWFHLTTDHGESFDSQPYSFYYDDNRYAWKHVQDPPFDLYWHAGDAAFGTSVLAAARQGVQRSQQWLPLADPTEVQLRVYDNAADVQLIAGQAGVDWQAGHTDPQTGILLFSLPVGPQQSLEVQRQVPHEIAHLMLYQSLGAEGYANLPAWLNEGIASNVEVYSDPARDALLEVANGQDGLIPLYSLCSAFPQEDASARLAYAEFGIFRSLSLPNLPCSRL